MKHYIIDGNNLIGKIPEIKSLQNIDPQNSREKLAFILDRYFSKSKQKVSLHFDGFAKDPIKTSKVNITYSDNKTADEKIREQIERAKNPKLITVVTSDLTLSEFAKVCSCSVIKSEKFAAKLSSAEKGLSEEDIIKDMSTDEFKKIFGVDE